jgi:hypothetical protein
VNQSPVQKQQQAREHKTKKDFGTARVLTVEEAIKKQEERKTKEQQVMHEKERAAALQGKVGFAKTVWKELQKDFDVFTRDLRNSGTQNLPLNRFGNGWPDWQSSPSGGLRHHSWDEP